MITDLTTGNIRKLLWSFSIPMLISVAFQQMYNIADSVIAGRFIGEDALAAVGASYPITIHFQTFWRQAIHPSEMRRQHHIHHLRGHERDSDGIWRMAGTKYAADAPDTGKHLF